MTPASTACNEDRPGRRRLLTTLLVACSTLCGLALVESAARFLPPPHPPAKTHITCDPVTGWRGPARGVFEYPTDGHYAHSVAWNSRGFRDRERSLKKEPNAFRIMMLGDSCLAGLEVEDSRTVRAVLEEILNTHAPAGRRFEVMAAGVTDWSPAQELAYFRAEGRFYEPDLVVALWFPGNDLADLMPGRLSTAEDGVDCYSPVYVLCDGTLAGEPIHPVPGASSLWSPCSPLGRGLMRLGSALYSRSRLYQIAESRLAQAARTSLASASLGVWIDSWLDGRRSDATLSALHRLTAEIHSELAREAAAVGADTVFCIAPYKEAVLFEVDERQRRRFLESRPGLRGMDPRLPNRAFRAGLEAKGLEVLDPHPGMVTEAARGRALFWEEDKHWRPEGHQHMAEFLAEHSGRRVVPGLSVDRVRLPQPRFVLHKDVEGWNVLGYDVDLAALVSGEPVDIRLHWLVPEHVDPEPSSDFHRLTGRRWAQVVRAARSLVRGGDFESASPDTAFPHAIRNLNGPEWLSSVSDAVEGNATRVAALRTTSEVMEIGFAAPPVPVGPDRLYLLSGAMRTEAVIGWLETQWMPAGTIEHPIAFVSSPRWWHHARLITAPTGAEEVRVAVSSSGGAGTSYVDDVALVELGELGSACRETTRDGRRLCGPPLTPIPPERSSHAARPAVELDLDVLDWKLAGYDADEERLARGEATSVTLHWIAPPGAQPSASADFRHRWGRRWVQVLWGVRNVLPDGSFERAGLDGFPHDIYAAPAGARRIAREARAGRATNAAMLENGPQARKSSLVSGLFAVRDDRLYLQTGWTKTNGGRAYIGRQWLPGQSYDYAVGEAEHESWRHNAQALRPPPGSTSAQLWLLNVESQGRAWFDDVAFVELGALDSSACRKGSSTGARCGPPLLASTRDSR